MPFFFHIPKRKQFTLRLDLGTLLNDLKKELMYKVFPSEFEVLKSEKN